MTYATKTDMQARFGAAELLQLSDIGTPRTGEVVDSVLDQALADATAWIDSFLVGRYTLPITDPAALLGLKLHCAHEARYLLMTAHADEAAIKSHDERAAFFRAVAKGDIPLIAPANVTAIAGVGPVLMSPGDKVFGRESAGDSCDGRYGRWGGL